MAKPAIIDNRIEAHVLVLLNLTNNVLKKDLLTTITFMGFF